jgi:hypothetical protein
VKNFIPRIPPGDGIALAARFVKKARMRQIVTAAFVNVVA